MKHIPQNRAGYTLAELSIALGLVVIIGGLAYSMLIGSTTLLAKNVSINASNITVRAALDRMYADLNQANAQPILIDAAGAPTAGPAAGFLVDRYVGGPYIVGNPGAGLPANTTNFRLFYSPDAAVRPEPKTNDVVVMNRTTRALISSVAISDPTAPGPNPLPDPGVMATITLPNPLGNYTTPAGGSITWAAGAVQTATLVHRKAYVVVPVNGTAGPAELRMYPDAEAGLNFNDPANYVILTRSIGTQTVNGLEEHKPFSFVPENGVSYLNIAVRVEDQRYNKRLATQQAKEFNTFLRVDTRFRPKNIPVNPPTLPPTP